MDGLSVYELGQACNVQGDITHMSETQVLTAIWGALPVVHMTLLTLSPCGLLSFSGLW